MIEEHFWLSIVGAICMMVVIIGGLSMAYFMHQNYLIAGMVANGTDPIEARCALYDSYSYEGSALICMEVAKQ